MPSDSSIIILSDVYHTQSDAGIPASLRGLHSGLNRSQQSLTSVGSQETETKMAKVLYDYSVRTRHCWLIMMLHFVHNRGKFFILNFWEQLEVNNKTLRMMPRFYSGKKFVVLNYEFLHQPRN